MILQLNPPFDMETPKGLGLCRFLIDYEMGADLFWVVFIYESGECWTINNRDIREPKNYTLGFRQIPVVVKTQGNFVEGL